MCKTKIVALKNPIPNGTRIPSHLDPGAIGKWVQDELKKRGYKINEGKGADMIVVGGYDVEVKSRKIDATADHQVGKMTKQDIIDTPFEDSPICAKVQLQYRVFYSETEIGNTLERIVEHTGIYDFTSPYIQEELRAAYEGARKTFKYGINSCTDVFFTDINGKPVKERNDTYISQAKTASAYFGYDKGNTFAFKIRNRYMQIMENDSEQKKKPLPALLG